MFLSSDDHRCLLLSKCILLFKKSEKSVYVLFCLLGYTILFIIYFIYFKIISLPTNLEIRIMCTCTAKCAHLAPLVNTSNKKHKAFQKVANTYHQVSHYSVTIVTSDLTVFVLGDSFDLRIHGDHKDKLLESI